MYNIAVIPGDGTGPEVVREGLKVLEAVSKKYGFSIKISNFNVIYPIVFFIRPGKFMFFDNIICIIINMGTANQTILRFII